MPVRLFVGNLPYETSEAELREHFSAVGPLSHVFIPVDRDTGRPRGFAFVEFMERAQAESAIAKLNNQPFRGRPLSVSEARAREDRPSGPRPGPGGPPSSRPPGPPRGEWTPRPAAPAPAAPGGESRNRRNFGPDAPRRGQAKPQRSRRDEKAGGPIPIRSGGRIYDVEDLGEDAGTGDESGFDDFASSRPHEDEEKES